MTYSEASRRLYSEGVVLYAAGDYAGAIQKWTALTQRPDAGELGERASHHIERARRIQQLMAGGVSSPPPPAPAHPDARRLYAEGVTLYAAGDYNEAIKRWNQVITHANPGDLADRSSAHVARARRILDLVGATADDERQAWQALADWLSNPDGSLRHIGGEGHGDSSYTGGTICWCGKDHGAHSYTGLTTCWCGVRNDYIGHPH